MKILIVDDSRTVHGFIEKTLEMAGIEFDELQHAYNGRDGLNMLEQHPIDLIFSDIHMPEMDGIEMIERIKQNPSYSSIPIIMISTEGSRVRIDRLNEMGISAFLRKPFTPEQLNHLVESVMGGMR
ncbi:response regulator [bacterium]|nr:response regulator [bacterium]